MENPKAHSSGSKTSYTHKQLKCSMDISSGLPRPLAWCVALVQGLLGGGDIPACLGKRGKGKRFFSHLLPQNMKLQETLSNLILVILPGSTVQEGRPVLLLGTMKRLNWSRVHPGMNNDLKNQCCEDFDRLVTFQLIL